MPYFSVLIASFNNNDYLRDAIQSVLVQSFEDWELVIVDDCSTDVSFQTLEEYGNNPKIRIFRNDENRGVGFTKDYCIRLSRGEICGFLDADDELEPDALQTMADSFKKNPGCSLIYSTHYVCDANLQTKSLADYVGVLDRGDFLLTQPGEKNISHFAAFKRASYLNTEGIPSDMRKAVDHYFYYLLEEQGAVFFVDKPLYYYRHHHANISIGGANPYIAMFWDFEAKRRAYQRRIENCHQLFLNNEVEYHEQFFSATLITTLVFRKKSLLYGTFMALKTYLRSKKRRHSVLWILQIMFKAFMLVFIKYPIAASGWHKR